MSRSSQLGSPVVFTAFVSFPGFLFVQHINGRLLLDAMNSSVVKVCLLCQRSSIVARLLVAVVYVCCACACCGNVLRVSVYVRLEFES
jgi:hypothetical protein